VEDLAQPSLAKRFSQEGKKRPLFELDVMFGGLGHGGEVICIGTWMF
jgi:hypothetical protein